MAGGAALDRTRHVVDVAHHLEILVHDPVGVLVPIRLGPDEERGPPGIAVGRLHHQVVAQIVGRGEGAQLGEARGAAERVRHAGHAGIVAELGGDDLGIDVGAQLGRRQRHLQAQLLDQLLAGLVEHDQERLALAAARLDQVGRLLVAEQVVADILHRLELARARLGRGDAARMLAVEAVEVGDVLEIADPLVEAQQVVGRGGDEIDRRLVGAEEGEDLGQAGELAPRRRHSLSPRPGRSIGVRQYVRPGLEGRQATSRAASAGDPPEPAVAMARWQRPLTARRQRRTFSMVRVIGSGGRPFRGANAMVGFRLLTRSQSNSSLGGLRRHGTTWSGWRPSGVVIRKRWRPQCRQWIIYHPTCDDATDRLVRSRTSGA